MPKRLSVNSKPIENAAGAIADGVAAALFTLLLAITLLLDGERIVNGVRRLVPARRSADADRFGRLVYDVVGRYIAGTLFVAVLAGVVMLIASLALGVPLAPLIAVWVAITQPDPADRRLPRRRGRSCCSALTQGAVVGVICLAIFLVYQQLENHVLQPLDHRARRAAVAARRRWSPRSIGVAAGGLVGGLFAIPLLGATKAIYLSTRSRRSAIRIDQPQ